MELIALRGPDGTVMDGDDENLPPNTFVVRPLAMEIVRCTV